MSKTGQRKSEANLRKAAAPVPLPKLKQKRKAPVRKAATVATEAVQTMAEQLAAEERGEVQQYRSKRRSCKRRQRRQHYVSRFSGRRRYGRWLHIGYKWQLRQKLQRELERQRQRRNISSGRRVQSSQGSVTSKKLSSRSKHFMQLSSSSMGVHQSELT